VLLILKKKFLIFWFLFDLLLRYFMQQLPVMNVKPLMTIPVKRNSVIHYLLGKTSISFFNILPLFIFVPFSVVLLAKGYPVLNVICWFLSIVAITYCINFINFLVNKNNVVFYSLLAFLVLAAGLEVYGIYKITEPIGKAFNFMYKTPYLVIIPLLLLVGLYKAVFNFVKKGFYLDDARPKQVMFMSFLFLFYGLIFYTQDVYRQMPAFLAFASMFVTGGFLMTFGQLVPSWDSEYYKMLMSQKYAISLFWMENLWNDCRRCII